MYSQGEVFTLTEEARQDCYCEYCPDGEQAQATHWIVGEVDSFGHEKVYVCAMHKQDHLSSFVSSTMGDCDWCSANHVTVSPTRDPDEGQAGRFYDVCEHCVKKLNRDLERENYLSGGGYEG